MASANLSAVLSVSPTFVKLKASRCVLISNASNNWINFSSEMFCKKKDANRLISGRIFSAPKTRTKK